LVSATGRRIWGRAEKKIRPRQGCSRAQTYKHAFGQRQQLWNRRNGHPFVQKSLRERHAKGNWPEALSTGITPMCHLAGKYNGCWLLSETGIATDGRVGRSVMVLVELSYKGFSKSPQEDFRPFCPKKSHGKLIAGAIRVYRCEELPNPSKKQILQPIRKRRLRV